MVVKFRFNKDHSRRCDFSWYKTSQEAEKKMDDVLQERKKEVENKGEMYEWKVVDEDEGAGLVGGAEVEDDGKGRSAWFHVLDVEFDEME